MRSSTKPSSGCFDWEFLCRHRLKVKDQRLFKLPVDELLHGAVVLKPCPARDEVAHDDALLKATEEIRLPAARRLGKNPSRVLERGRRDERIRTQRRLCNSQQERSPLLTSAFEKAKSFNHNDLTFLSGHYIFSSSYGFLRDGPTS